MAVKATASVTVFNVSDGADGRMLYATCPTAAATAAKVATVSSGTVTLCTGLTVAVCFTYANTAASPTLNVDGTGAKAIFVNGAAVTASDYWVAGATHTFVYDGTSWVMSDVQSVNVGGTNLVTKKAFAGNATNFERMFSRGAMLCATNVIFENQTLIAPNTGDFSQPNASVNQLGEQVTISFEHRLAEGGTSRAVRCYPYQDTGLSIASEKSFTPTDEWQRFELATRVKRFTVGNGSTVDGTVYTYKDSENNTQSRTNGCIYVWDAAGMNYYRIRNLKIERGTVATDWSPAPEDVQTGIDDAQGTANAGIKEQVTLFYAAASATTPSKPTANVTTSNATTYAAWNRTLPTYRSANQYLYVCTQSLTNGGTYSWSAVEPGSYADWAAALGTRLTTAETQISQNTADIALKASQTEVSALGTRVSTAEASIDANRAQIALKVSQAQFDAMQVGGTNRVANSAGVNIDNLGATAGSRKEYGYFNTGLLYSDLKSGTEVVISFDLELTVNTANPYIRVYNTNKRGPKSFTQKDLYFTSAVGTTIKGRYHVLTEIVDQQNVNTTTTNAIEFYTIYDTSNWFKISNLKLEVGNVPTAWSPAPEDMATSAELEVTADSINQRVEGIAGDVATVTTTANSFSVQLGSAVADLTGDISTAQTTANAGVKETVQLFFASNSTAAPAKPTANVTTSSATTYAAWNRTLPTYSAAYPYLYTCVQTLTSGGTYAWTDVDSGSYADHAADTAQGVATLEVRQDSILQTVDDLAGDVATVATTANEFSVQLQSAIADLTGDIDTNAEAIATVTAMVRVTSDNGRPVLGLGSSGSTLAVQLTNDQLSFLDSGQAVAYINGQRLYITTAEVTGMLKMGNFALVPQSDGSLALKLVG